MCEKRDEGTVSSQLDLLGLVGPLETLVLSWKRSCAGDVGGLNREDGRYP